MTPNDGFPALEWFSQADLLAYSQQHDPKADAGSRAADLAGCHDRLRQVGFSTLNYIAFEMIGRRVLRAYLMRELTPASFIQPYMEDLLYEVDPRFMAVRQSGFPVAWRVDRFEAEMAAGADRQVAVLSASLRAHGMNSGVIFGLSAPRRDLRVAVSLTSEAHDTDWIDDRVMGAALAVSLIVHRLALPYIEARSRSARDVTLVDEQLAVLDRLVKGLSDQEIATALQTSLHKVNYHIKILQNAFNVENRAQLAYMAARWAPDE
jgi:DNA-binding CsgD family transcriptional regulator